MKIYKEKINIPYYDCDYKEYMTPSSILKHLSEISITHNELTIDKNKLEEGHYGWMLNKWKVEINNYPKAKENIRVETWISRVEMFYVNREFIIYNEKDEEIVRATALWIFLDMERRRPTRVKKEFIDEKNILDKVNFKDFLRFSRDEVYENSKEFYVRRSDIDTNNHVNNVKYLDWMLESIPDEVYDNYVLESYEIDYKQEVSYPSKINSKNKLEIQNDKEIEIYHGIFKCNDNTDNVLAKSKWRKRYSI